MQKSSLWASTLTATKHVCCIDIRCSHWRYTKEYQHMIYISLHIGHPTLWSCRVHPTVGGQVSSLASGCVWSSKAQTVSQGVLGGFVSLVGLGWPSHVFSSRTQVHHPLCKLHPTISCTWHARLVPTCCSGSSISPSKEHHRHVAARRILSFQLEVCRGMHHKGWFSAHHARNC